jgi:hypothetical protein
MYRLPGAYRQGAPGTRITAMDPGHPSSVNLQHFRHAKNMMRAAIFMAFLTDAG